MTSLVRRYLKTAVGFLALGLALGGWMMARREFAGAYPSPYLISAHTHAILVGFVMLTIQGVALWMFPRPEKGDTRYRPRAAEAAYWLVAAGTAARVAGELARQAVPGAWLRWAVVLALPRDAPAHVRAGRPAADPDAVATPPLEGRTPQAPCLDADASPGTPATARAVPGTPATAEAVRPAADRLLARLPLTPAERESATQALAAYLAPHRARPGRDPDGYHVASCPRETGIHAGLLDLNGDDTPELYVTPNFFDCAYPARDSAGLAPLATMRTAVFVRDADGRWAPALTLDGWIGAMPTRTRGYVDLTDRDRLCQTVFRWDGTRYAPAGRTWGDDEAGCKDDPRGPEVPATVIPLSPRNAVVDQNPPDFVRGRSGTGTRPPARP